MLFSFLAGVGTAVLSLTSAVFWGVVHMFDEDNEKAKGGEYYYDQLVTTNFATAALALLPFWIPDFADKHPRLSALWTTVFSLGYIWIRAMTTPYPPVQEYTPLNVPKTRR